MFGRKKAVKGCITCCVEGEAIPLDGVCDEAFSSKMLGDGIAVIPCENTFVSPCDGEIVGVSKTAHAYNILSNDGLEILIHIGIDTVELGGKGFDAKVKAGDKVKRNDTLCVADIEFIKKRGYDTVTPIVISDFSKLSFLDRKFGKAKAGDILIDYVI